MVYDEIKHCRESYISSRKSLKNINCLNCNIKFNTRDSNPWGSRYPLLLQCGHSVCETCVQSSIKVTRSIICRECNFTSSGLKENDSDWFPLSIHVLGKLAALQMYRRRDNRTSFFSENCGDFSYSVVGQTCTSQSLAKIIYCEECSFSASWYCENCRCNFCTVCWVKVHGSAKSLKKHSQIALKNSDTRRIKQKKCSLHESQNLEFFCNGCSTLVCAHCVILQHQGKGHFPITLKEKNLEILSEVKASAIQVEQVLKTIGRSKEKIRELQDASMQVSTQKMAEWEAKIVKKFSSLHGILQLEEERCLKKLRETTSRSNKKLKDTYEQLDSYAGVVESLLNEYNTTMKQLEFGDLISLQKKMEEAKKMCCLLVVENLGPTEVEVKFEEKLIEMIESFCSVEPSSELAFELRTGVELLECQCEESRKESGGTSDSPPGAESEHAGSASRHALAAPGYSFSEEAAKGESEEASLSRAPSSPNEFYEGKSYSVRVSHIKNPGEFYVLLNSNLSKQESIERRAHEAANCSFTVPTAVKKDDLFLAQFSGNKKWYRGRVMGTACGASRGEESVPIYFLDCGNSEMVPLSRLRAMPEDMREESPLAVKCMLFECLPKEEKWCQESYRTMEKVLNGNTVIMHVKKVRRDLLEVDLSVIYPDDEMGRELGSVRDVLMFLNMASFVKGSKDPQSSSSSEYKSQRLPAAGEVFDCTITHVNSPSDFYIQPALENTLYELDQAMALEKYYTENFYKGIIYNPVVGMPCVAKFSVDQKWYRAKIIDVPGKKLLTVFYVDYGNTETVPWMSVRKLNDVFLKLPPLAFKCELVGIPAGVDCSLAAKSRLEEYVYTGNCRVEVQTQLQQVMKLKVVLYVQVEGKEIIMNDLLVELNRSDVQSVSPMKTSWTSKPVETNVKFRDFSGAFNEEIGVRRRSKLSAQKLKELHEYKKKLKSEKVEREEAEEVEEMEEAEEMEGFNETNDEAESSEDAYRVKIDVISAKSPSSVYVIISALSNDYEELQRELFNFYKGSEPGPGMELSAGSRCAVYSFQKGSWFRATLLSILPNDRVEVFLEDEAAVSTEPVSALRALHPMFTKSPPFAIKCHLANIGPPGSEWPTVSSEFLQGEIASYRELFMVEAGDLDNQSLPVELWVKKTIHKGALEPTHKVWIKLNDVLVDEGFAVPLKLKMLYSGASAQERPEKKPKKELSPNVKENSPVSDSSLPGWLPPEPLDRFHFIGLPTYVDANANLYILDENKEKEKLELLFSTFHREFQDSDPEDYMWTAGQMCMVRYHVDHCWYRGQVLEVHEDYTYEVLFVDYGNVETCENADLRSKIKLQDIPILSHKFRLANVKPMASDGKWSTAVLEILHSLVVDKNCEVTVLELSKDPNEASVISLRIIDSDVEVGELLVSEGLALPSSTSYGATPPAMLPPSPLEERKREFGVPVGPSCPDRERNLGFGCVKSQVDDYEEPFVPLKIPDECDGFCIEVTALTSSEEFFGNVVDWPGLPSSLRSVLTRFKCLEEQLTVEGHSQPLLNSLLAGEPCCSPCPWKKEAWGRGEIQTSEGEEKNSLSVFYVDHGRKENVAKDLLHKCKPEWLDVPKMSLKFKLANVKRSVFAPEFIYKEALRNCLAKTNLPFAKIIKQNEGILEVELRTHCGGSLVYQDMIDNNLMMYSWLAIKPLSD